LFGIIQATMTEFFGENHRSRHDWTCQRAAACFIDSCNARDSGGAKFFLVTKTAAPMHPIANLG
jgi:hypothetical protein